MIQRIQSLYLLIGMVLIILVLFLPVYKAQTTQPDNRIVSAEMTALQINSWTVGDINTIQRKILIFPLSLTLILVILTGFDIFLYKNRKQQLILCRFLILLNTALIAAMIFAADNVQKTLTDQSFTGHYTLWAIIPVLPIILYFLALRGMMKDDSLIKSADRIR
jgi:hypothetical protein